MMTKTRALTFDGHAHLTLERRLVDDHAARVHAAVHRPIGVPLDDDVLRVEVGRHAARNHLAVT